MGEREQVQLHVRSSAHMHSSHLLDNITTHGPQATIAVRAESRYYSLMDLTEQYGVVRFAIDSVCAAPARQTCCVALFTNRRQDTASLTLHPCAQRSLCMMYMTLIKSMALFVLRLVKWVRLQLAKRVESLFSIRRLARCKRCLGCDKRCDRNRTRKFAANSLK